MPSKPGIVWYRTYLACDHWISLRDAKVEDVGFKCERCPRKTGLQVHHKHYRSLWREKFSDLECLCDECHQKLHDAEVARKAQKQGASPKRWAMRRYLEMRIAHLHIEAKFAQEHGLGGVSQDIHMEIMRAKQSLRQKHQV